MVQIQDTYLQAAASAAELQKEKNDVGGLQNSTFGGGITRSGCLERPRPGFSSIFIDFPGFGRHPKQEGLPGSTEQRRPITIQQKYVTLQH